MPKVKKLTADVLRTIVLEEKKKLKNIKTHADDAVETDASDFAQSLSNHIDYVKALKIKEAKLIKAAKKLSEKRTQLKRKILKEL